MKKKDIIKSSEEYTEIIKNSKYKKNDYLIIYYRKKLEENNRFGISVPKKTAKAVYRNKIKRQIKDIIDKNKNYIHSEYDYVIIIRKRLIELNYKEMEINFINLIKKIGENNEKKH